jgi:hypothetical protein
MLQSTGGILYFNLHPESLWNLQLSSYFEPVVKFIPDDWLDSLKKKFTNDILY